MYFFVTPTANGFGGCNNGKQNFCTISFSNYNFFVLFLTKKYQNLYC